MRSFFTIAASVLLAAESVVCQDAVLSMQQGKELLPDDHVEQLVPVPAPGRQARESNFPPGPLFLIAREFPPGRPPKRGPFLTLDPKVCGQGDPDGDPLAYACIKEALEKECTADSLKAATVKIAFEGKFEPYKLVALRGKGRGDDVLCGGGDRDDRRLTRHLARGGLGGCGNDLLDGSPGICTVCGISGKDEDLLRFEPESVCTDGTPSDDIAIIGILEAAFKVADGGDKKSLQLEIHTSCSSPAVVECYGVEAILVEVNPLVN